MDVYDGIPAVAVLEADGTLVAAQTQGEFRHARSMTILEIVTFFHRWAPASGSALSMPPAAEIRG
jgi:hypothetical protein